MKSSLIQLIVISLTSAAAIQLTFGQSYTTANAVNNSSEIAGGMCVDNCNEFHATLIGRNGLQDFGTFGGPASLAFGLNDRGEVVGQSDTAELADDGQFVSVAFLADRNGVHNLGTLPGYAFSQAFAINNTGLIVGRVYNSNPEDPVALMRAVTFLRDGAVRDLGTLGGATSLAFGVNDRGQIVGRSQTPNGEQHAFAYDCGVMQDLGTLGGNLSTARAINSQGGLLAARGWLCPDNVMRS